MLDIIAMIKQSKREIEELKQQFATGQITEEEFNQRKIEVAQKLEKRNKIVH